MTTRDKLRNTVEELATKINGWNVSTSNPSFEAFDRIREAAGQLTDAIDHFDRLLDRNITEGEADYARKKLEQLITESIQENLTKD
jgi:hypothetical protein